MKAWATVATIVAGIVGVLAWLLGDNVLERYGWLEHVHKKEKLPSKNLENSQDFENKTITLNNICKKKNITVTFSYKSNTPLSFYEISGPNIVPISRCNYNELRFYTNDNDGFFVWKSFGRGKISEKSINFEVYPNSDVSCFVRARFNTARTAAHGTISCKALVNNFYMMKITGVVVEI